MKLTYEQKLDAMTSHAWEIWTHNGKKALCDRETTEKQARLAAQLTYHDGISDLEWLSATLKELGGSGG